MKRAPAILVAFSRTASKPLAFFFPNKDSAPPAIDPDIPAALPGESKMAAIRTRQDAINMINNAVFIGITSKILITSSYHKTLIFSISKKASCETFNL